MSRATLIELKNKIRRAAEIDYTDFVKNDELIDYINDSLSELWDILVASCQDYFIHRHKFNLVVDQESYPLPSDFYKLTKVFYVDTNGRNKMNKVNLDKLDYFSNTATSTTSEDSDAMYFISGNKFWITPPPATADVIELWYVPQATKLMSDSDEVDISIVNGWDKYITASVLAIIKAKEESDPTFWLMEKERQERRIVRMATNRDQSESESVSDYYRRFE